jgi:hypothetical protein
MYVCSYRIHDNKSQINCTYCTCSAVWVCVWHDVDDGIVAWHASLVASPASFACLLTGTTLPFHLGSCCELSLCALIMCSCCLLVLSAVVV